MFLFLLNPILFYHKKTLILFIFKFGHLGSNVMSLLWYYLKVAIYFILHSY